MAFAVLAEWWLVPAAICTLFYFVLAPLVARRPPIMIGPIDRRTPAAASLAQFSCNGSLLISAVSQRVMLAPGHKFLIRPEYCQGQPPCTIVSTKVLCDWHRWLTSIAAHLWMLKRMRTSQTAAIVVSSTADALDEVALLEIGPGDAFVLQPRGLVGIMYRTGEWPRIRSHWRLGTLHACLTLQLRYLSFEGPHHADRQGVSGRTVSLDARHTADSYDEAWMKPAWETLKLIHGLRALNLGMANVPSPFPLTSYLFTLDFTEPGELPPSAGESLESAGSRAGLISSKGLSGGGIAPPGFASSSCSQTNLETKCGLAATPYVATSSILALQPV